MSRNVTVCPECGAAVVPTSQSGGAAIGGEKSARSPLLRWSVWIVAGSVLLWIAIDVLLPRLRRPGAAPVPVAVGSPQHPRQPTASDRPAAPASSGNLPPWAPAARGTTAPGTAAEAPAPDPGASAVQQELLRIGASAGLDVGSAEGPVAGWLGSGTPQQQANRARLAQVLMRCVRELQTDGTDPKLLPALHECEDRGLAQGGQ